MRRSVSAASLSITHGAPEGRVPIRTFDFSSRQSWTTMRQLSMILLPSFAAAGAQIVLYQLGGNELPPEDAPLSAVDPGLVAPLLTISGNPRTAKAAGDYLDVSTGGVLLGTETLDAAGEHILEEIVRAANGRATRGETMRYPEPFEVVFEGPFI